MSGYVTGVMGMASSPDHGAGTPPSALPGLVGWWDTSNFASLTLSGPQFVLGIADSSGAGNDMVKVGSSNFPNYFSNAINTSHPGINFTGTDLVAVGVSPFPMGTGNTITAFYVGTLAQVASSTNGRFLSYSIPGVHEDFNFAGTWATATTNPVDGTQFNWARNSVNILSTGLTATPAVHRIIFTISSGGGVTIYIDGLVTGAGTSGGNWTDAGSLSLGRDAFTDAQYCSFTAAEWGVATGFINSSVVGSLDAYLKTKWGL